MNCRVSRAVQLLQGSFGISIRFDRQLGLLWIIQGLNSKLFEDRIIPLRSADWRKQCFACLFDAHGWTIMGKGIDYMMFISVKRVVAKACHV